MHARLRMYKYCYSNLGAVYPNGLYGSDIDLNWNEELNLMF